MRALLLPILLLVVAPGPDLAAGNLTLTGGVPGAGQQVYLQLQVNNTAGEAAGPFRVKALLSPKLPVTARDAEIGSTEVATIAGGASIPVDLDAFVPASTAPGRYRLGAFIDPENLVLDAVRSNNGAATATFFVNRAPGSLELGDSVDLGLGPIGTDAFLFWAGEGAEVTVKARGMRGVRPALGIQADAGGGVLAENDGGPLRWTAPADGTYRIEVRNLAETVGRVRLTTAGRVRIRALPTAAPAGIPFLAWEDGTVVLSAVYEGAASPLVFRDPLGPEFGAPGRSKGHRARLGPMVPLATGTAALLLGGEGAAVVTIDSRTTRFGALLVR